MYACIDVGPDEPVIQEVSSDQYPVILKLSKEDKELIANMGDQEIICFYPEGTTINR